MTGASMSRPARPTPGPTNPYRFPRFHRRTLDNGLRLIVAPVPKLPLVTITALVDAGAVTDPAGKEGLAQLTARLLTEGTLDSDGAELAERFERIGASVEAHAEWDNLSLTLTVMTAHAADALALAAEVLQRPAFSEREVARLAGERLAELLQLRAEPRELADESFARILYEPSSRYAAPAGGTESSVRGITRDDVTAFYHRRYSAGATTLILVGDVEVEEAARLVDASFRGWSGAAPPRVEALDRAARTTRTLTVVHKADAPQSELRVGQVGVRRPHPDYFPLVVMNAILGGLFNSRVNLNLREAHAYTYGAFSSFDWRRQAGPFAVSTAVRSDVTDAAVREILAEIERMRETLVSPEELTLATSYLDGVFPIRYETTAAIASALEALTIYELPDDYFDTYRQRVRGVTAEQVRDAARQYLDPAVMQIVAVGDAERIRAPLANLGLGDAVVERPMA